MELSEQLSFGGLFCVFFLLSLFKRFHKFIKFGDKVSVIQEQKLREIAENEAKTKRKVMSRLKEIKFVVNSYMSFNSVVIFVGMVTETYLYGGRVLANLISISIGYFMAFTFFQPFFYNLDKDIKSPYQYLEKRYRDKKIVRVISASAGFLFHFLFVSLHLWACATILTTTFPQIHLWISIVIIGGVSIVTSFFGGFKQSVKVIIVQFVFMMFGIVAAMVITFSFDGNKSAAELWQIAGEYQRRNFIFIDFDLRARYTILNQVISLPIPWITFHSIFLPNFSKYRSIGTKLKSRAILISHLPVMFLVNGSFIFAGIACFAYFYGCDPIFTEQVENKNQIATFWIIKALSLYIPTIAGFFLASIVFYAISQYSIGIGLCAKLAINDILTPVKSKPFDEFNKKLVKSVLCALIGALTIIVSILFQHAKNSILSLFYVANNSINSPILGLFLLSILNPFANCFGACLAFVINLGINIWLALSSVAFSNLKNQEFPPNTFQCFNSTFTTSNNQTSFDGDTNDYYPTNETLFYLYSISAIWYCLFSLLFNLIFGSLFSLLYSFIKTRSFDADKEFKSERQKYLYSFKKDFLKN